MALDLGNIISQAQQVVTGGLQIFGQIQHATTPPPPPPPTAQENITKWAPIGILVLILLLFSKKLLK